MLRRADQTATPAVGSLWLAASLPDARPSRAATAIGGPIAGRLAGHIDAARRAGRVGIKLSGNPVYQQAATPIRHAVNSF